MKFHVLAAALLLAGCATTSQMAQRPADRTYSSSRPRAAIAECLLDRVTSADLIPERTVGAGITTIGFSSGGALRHPGIFLFTIRDAGNGSTIEARMLHGLLGYSLTTAETCF